MRRALILVVIACAATAVASPKKPAAPAKTAEPAPPAPIDPALQAVMDRIAKGDHKAALDDLAKLAPQDIEGLKSYLARPHQASVEDRRKVLEGIAAQVPDAQGRFKQPERKSEKEEKQDDDLDWMAKLAAVDASTPGLGEVIADDAAIRALAGTKDLKAAYVVFDAAFAPETMIYRDECGRYLRKMEPWSLPALIKESQSRDYDRKRYANYQLERMDRQDAFKALQATTGDEALQLAVLNVFRETRHREAVHAVWSKVDADSPRVRKAARDAWMAYVAGPPPPPAPKKKLMLPGGKLTKKEKPLWLTYRELADNELRKAANEYFGEDLPLADPTLDDSDDEPGHRKPKSVKIDVVEYTNKLFAYFDDQRAKKEAAQWGEAKAKADKGDTAGAVAMLDRLLAANPERSDAAQMAPVYMKMGKDLEAKKQWADAAAAYSKAAGLDPKGPLANDALAAHYFTLGKSLEASGKDGGPDFRQAIALKPDYAPAKTAERESLSATGSRPRWLLYSAALAALVALGLFATAMVRRRA